MSTATTKHWHTGRVDCKCDACVRGRLRRTPEDEGRFKHDPRTLRGVTLGKFVPGDELEPRLCREDEDGISDRVRARENASLASKHAALATRIEQVVREVEAVRVAMRDARIINRQDYRDLDRARLLLGKVRKTLIPPRAPV